MEATDEQLMQAVARGDLARVSYLDLLAVNPPDQLAIEKKQEEIQRIQGSAQDQVIVHFLLAGSFLNPEQQSRFFQLIKGRIETGTQVCPSLVATRWAEPVEEKRQEINAAPRPGSNGKF